MASCSSDDPVTNPNEPRGLNIEIVNPNDGSGMVTVAATAFNTVEYHFYMGDGQSQDPLVSTDGIIEYKYQVLGTYLVEVRAYGTSGRYVKKTKEIVVKSDTPVSVGQGYTSPTEYEGYELVWNDEFIGNALDGNNWTHEIGTGCPNLCGWGNNELQYYREENTSVGDGVLTITAKKESFQGSSYTSSRIITEDKREFKYGRFDIRALLPRGQGLWPAIWMLGANHDAIGWPFCGEIDIMEMIGGDGRENTVYGNVYWDENGTRNQPDITTLDSGNFFDEYHVFSIIWDETEICWLVDDVKFHSFSITQSTRAAFRNEFFFILNVAVGGNFPGSPDETTVFPTEMKVDYIRVFQEKN